MSGAYCGLTEKYCGHAGDCDRCEVMQEALANADEFSEKVWVCCVCLAQLYKDHGREGLHVPGYYAEGRCAGEDCQVTSRFLQIVLIR